MQYRHNKRLVPAAKALRKNMTKEERHLWFDFLRDYPIRFMRQKPLGRYIVDFYCSAAHLVIELDGSQHFDEYAMAQDVERTAYLERFGVSVVRIPNNEINENFQGVCDYIDRLVKQSPSHADA